MFWLVAIAAALMFAVCGRRLRETDEVYALALCVAGLVSGLWGFAIAPTSVQLMLGMLALSKAQTLGIQANSFRF